MKEVLKAFFTSNGRKTSFRPTFFWVSLILLALVIAVYLELIEGKGARIPLITVLLGSAGLLLGIYNVRKIRGTADRGPNAGQG